MTPGERLEAAAERFAESVAASIAAQVERAVALERDRYEARISKLERQMANVTWLITDQAHSVRVDS